MTRSLRPLAALAVLAMIGAGCSKAPAGTSAGNTIAATRAKSVKFAQCMRSNGVTNFPDPDASGKLTIDGVVNGSSLDPNTAAFKQAMSACKSLEPAGFMGQKRTARQQASALKFAQCMRDNGVKDFPDPTTSGPIIDVNGAHSIPGFQAAEQKCRDILAGALAGH